MKLHELLNQIRYRENGASIYSPDEFLNLIRFFDNFQVPDVQHDAHEFLCKMIESLNSSKVAHINNGGIEWKESNDFKHIFGTTLGLICKKVFISKTFNFYFYQANLVQNSVSVVTDVERNTSCKNGCKP